MVAVAALGLVILGVTTGAPGLVLLGVLAALQHAISSIWSRYGLDRVTYERGLSADRAVWGDRIAVSVTVENRKILPLAWIRADDHVSDEARAVDHDLAKSSLAGYSVLRNVWTLAPFERVRRTAHFAAAARGRVRFDLVRLTVADIFGSAAGERDEHHEATYLVRPRTVPIRTSTGAIVPEGSRRARTGLIDDPSLFAGVRPFQLGDARRRIHERASARTGQPMTKRFEPSTMRTVVIALDLQTGDGPHWMLTYDEDLVESLAVAAGSIARRILADGVACGLAVNGWTYALSPLAIVSPRAGADHLARIADLLARMSPTASIPFTRLLAALPAYLPPGAVVMTLGGRDPSDMIPSLRRLRASGFLPRHVALGPHANEQAVRLRRAGIPAGVGRLEPDWRTSEALTITG